MKIARSRRWGVYLVTALLWLTGLGVWLLQRGTAAAGGLPETLAPWKTRLLAAHGAGAMLFLVLFGALLPRHVLPGWRVGDSRGSGGVSVALGVLLAATGWFLYYEGSESIREAAVILHDGLGLLLPALLGAHVILARRRR